MKVGYIRVSTQEQNTIRQEVLMQALGVEQVFIDRMSGKNLARPELQKLLAFVRTGDCVIVESISRFARNTRDLLELIEQLQSKQVQFVSKKEAIDTTTPTGKFMLTVFGAVAELEREYILQRQREGIAIAKENGVYKGRKPIVCAGFDSVLMLWRRREITAVDAGSENTRNESERGNKYDLVCIGFPAHSSTAADRRHGLCCKMITWAAVANAIAAFSKGVLLALELLGYDSSN